MALWQTQREVMYCTVQVCMCGTGNSLNVHLLFLFKAVQFLACCACLYRCVLSYAHIKLSCICNRLHGLFFYFLSTKIWKGKPWTLQGRKLVQQPLSRDEHHLVTLSCLLYYSVSLLCLPRLSDLFCYFTSVMSMWKCAGAANRYLLPCSFTCAFVCLSLSCSCVANYQRWQAEKEVGSTCVFQFKLLLLSIKKADLHVYNWNIVYTAKQAELYQALKRVVLPFWSQMQLYSLYFFLLHLFLLILFYSTGGQSGCVP